MMNMLHGTPDDYHSFRRRVILSNNEESIRILVDLGLSGTQAKSYLGLLGIGSGSISEIANVSKVARPDTYRAMIDLLESGLVEKIVTVPTKYKPLSITEAVGVLMLKRSKESIDLNKKANKLIEKIRETENTKSRSEDTQFFLIRGEAIELELRKHLENAKGKISVMVSWERLLRWVGIDTVSIQSALKRNVNIRIITEEFYGSNDSRALQALERFTNFELRYAITPLEVWLRLYDDKEILLTTSTKREETNYDAVFSNNPSLVELAQSYFNAAWFSASIPQNQAFRRDRRQFDYLFANLNSGFSYNKIIFGPDGKPIDFIMLETNLAFKRITGIEKNILGERGTNVFPSKIKTNLIDLLATYWPIISHGKSARFEYRFQGSERCFSILAYSPEKGYFVSIFEDITELKRQENKIKSLSKFPSENPLPILRINGAGTILYGNEAALSLLIEWKSQVNKRAPEDICQLVTNSLKSHIKIELEQSFGTKVFSLLLTPVTLEGYVNIYANDITERKKAEQELRKSEKNYSSLFENMIDGFAYCQMIFDEKGKPVDFVYLQVNDAFERITGLKRDLIIGKKVSQAIPEINETNPELFEIYGRVSLTGQKEKFEHALKPLNLWLNVSVYSPAKGYFAAVLEDITERKKSEEALTKSDVNYRNLLNGMSESVWVIDFERNFIDVNDAAVKALGYSKEELLRIGVEGIDKNLSPEEAKSLLSRLVSVGAQVFETEHTTKDGKKIPVEISSSLITYNGKHAVLSIARNITERKKAEQALIESEERSRKAFSTSPDAFMITTLRESLIIECNDAFLEMFGYSRQEVMNKRALDLNLWADPTDRERIVLLLKKEGKIRNKESFYRRKNGEIFPASFSVSLLETNNQQLSIITARDISVTRKNEAILREREAT